MTTPATADAFHDQIPTEKERLVADQLRRLIAGARLDHGGEAILRVADIDGRAEAITLTPLLSGILLDLLRPLSRGEPVALIPTSQMLTTQQAADLLNVSRPHLVKLLEQGAMPFDSVGRHRRVRAADLFVYKKERDARRDAALKRLADIDGDTL